MPSFDTAKLSVMANQLLQASEAQDWVRLQQLDGLLAHWAQASQQDTVDVAQRQAWRTLLQAHAQALHKCRSAKQAVAVQLRSLNNSQEAQKAYAWQELLG